jgi:Protein of unknown function (DUF3303)
LRDLVVDATRVTWTRAKGLNPLPCEGGGKEEAPMLFVALLKTRGTNTFQEGVARRMQWDYPEGANVLAEYWLETEAPRVVAVMEAESMDAFGQIRMDWGDMFEIEVFPAVTGEQGLEMARQAMSG